MNELFKQNVESKHKKVNINYCHLLFNALFYMETQNNNTINVHSNNGPKAVIVYCFGKDFVCTKCPWRNSKLYDCGYIFSL